MTVGILMTVANLSMLLVAAYHSWQWLRAVRRTEKQLAMAMAKQVGQEGIPILRGITKMYMFRPGSNSNISKYFGLKPQNKPIMMPKVTYSRPPRNYKQLEREAEYANDVQSLPKVIQDFTPFSEVSEVAEWMQRLNACATAAAKVVLDETPIERQARRELKKR